MVFRPKAGAGTAGDGLVVGFGLGLGLGLGFGSDWLDWSWLGGSWLDWFWVGWFWVGWFWAGWFWVLVFGSQAVFGQSALLVGLDSGCRSLNAGQG